MRKLRHILRCDEASKCVRRDQIEAAGLDQVRARERGEGTEHEEPTGRGRTHVTGTVGADVGAAVGRAVGSAVGAVVRAAVGSAAP